MILHAILAALIAAQSPGTSVAVDSTPLPPSLSQQNRAVIRCSAAFAMVAHGQNAGNQAAQQWPDVGRRGREFFVVSLAQLMDETGLDRAGVARLVQAEAQRLWDSDEVDAVMPACLLMLQSAGL